MALSNSGIIPEYTTITELVRFTGLNPRTVKDRTAKIPISHTSGLKKYLKTIDALRSCFIKHEEKKKEQSGLSEAKAAYYLKMTEKIDIEIQRLSEKYVDAEEFSARQTKRFLAFKEKFYGISKRLAPQMAKSTAEAGEEILNSALSEALNELVEEEIANIEAQKEVFERELEAGSESNDEPETEEEQNS